MPSNPFRLGLRTFKTGLAVFFCLLIFQLFNRDTPMIACLSAVFAMRQDVSATVSFGTSRIVGNLMGGGLGIVYFLLARQFNHAFLFDLLGIPLLVMLLIILSDAFKINNGIIGACATLLMIIFTINETHSFVYALDRVLDTIIGTLIAIATNHFILPYHPEPTEVATAKTSDDSVESLTELEDLVAKQANEIAALTSALAQTTQKKD